MHSEDVDSLEILTCCSTASPVVVSVASGVIVLVSVVFKIEIVAPVGGRPRRTEYDT